MVIHQKADSNAQHKDDSRLLERDMPKGKQEKN
jgi:hypothetical protein